MALSIRNIVASSLTAGHGAAGGSREIHFSLGLSPACGAQEGWPLEAMWKFSEAEPGHGGWISLTA
jgi:hypothetical protein